MSYDESNVFARILRGEIPNRTVKESAHTLAFADVNPQAPHHVLVIPKGRYVDYDDFSRNAPAEEIVDFHRTAGAICAELAAAPTLGGEGYRVIANSGGHGRQEVPHFHLHILAGRDVGPMLEGMKPPKG